MDVTPERQVLDAALTLIHSRRHTSPKPCGILNDPAMRARLSTLEFRI